MAAKDEVQEITGRITSAQASEILQKCYSRGGMETFPAFLARSVQDPIQPHDPETKKYRLHPLVMSLLAFSALGVVGFLFFSYYWHK